MKTIYKNIYTILALNRFIVLIVTICAFASSGFSGWLMYDTHQKALNNAFAVSTDGNVIPLQWVDQRENLLVESKAHLEFFHSNFYGIDASNYEKNVEKALWLGNRSVDELYQQKKAEGVYNRLLQYSLLQKVISIQSTVNLDQTPYAFITTLQFQVNRGTVTDTYELVTTGKLIHVDRNFPHNPHGLLITNYFEKTLKKISDAAQQE